jgi:hypothetical protein
MLPPPPSLQVEATASETRILLDHGRPIPPVARWRTWTLAAWAASLVLGWFLPFLFCPAALFATLGVVVAFVLDARRTVVERLVLRRGSLRVVQRGPLGRRVVEVPWGDLPPVRLDSELGQSGARDAVRLDLPEGPLRLAVGRSADDLGWIRDCLEAVRGRLCGAAAALEDVADAVPEEAPEPSRAH